MSPVKAKPGGKPWCYQEPKLHATLQRVECPVEFYITRIGSRVRRRLFLVPFRIFTCTDLQAPNRISILKPPKSLFTMASSHPISRGDYYACLNSNFIYHFPRCKTGSVNTGISYCEHCIQVSRSQSPSDLGSRSLTRPHQDGFGRSEDRDLTLFLRALYYGRPTGNRASAARVIGHKSSTALGAASNTHTATCFSSWAKPLPDDESLPLHGPRPLPSHSSTAVGSADPRPVSSPRQSQLPRTRAPATPRKLAPPASDGHRRPRVAETRLSNLRRPNTACHSFRHSAPSQSPRHSAPSRRTGPPCLALPRRRPNPRLP